MHLTRRLGINHESLHHQNHFDSDKIMLFTEPIYPIRPINPKRYLKETNDLEKYTYKPIFYFKRVGSRDSLLESKYLHQSVLSYFSAITFISGFIGILDSFGTLVS